MITQTAEKPKLALITAERIALACVEVLRPACERIEIAGSIRRRAPLVGDIELVAVPRWEGTGADLFGDPIPTNCLETLCADRLEDGTFQMRRDKNGRPAWGERFKRISFRGLPVDLFIVVPPAQWGVLFTIRTGPADYAHQLVIHVGQSFRDWRGFRRGGLLPTNLRVHEGALIYSTGEGTNSYVETPTEEAFFAAINVDYKQPMLRK